MTIKYTCSESYSYSVDCVSRSQWHLYLALFDDANVYQTWDYVQVVYPSRQVHRVVLYGGADVVALAQVQVMTIPLVRRGIAYVLWGPAWRRHSLCQEGAVFEAVLEALREVFVERAGLLLRIAPRVEVEGEVDLRRCLDALGFVPNGRLKAYRTLVIDMARSLSDIRAGFSRNWRKALSRAERSDLEVVTGTGDGLYRDFLEVYGQVLERKGFDARIDVASWRRMQTLLPEREKLRILVAYHDKVPAAALIVSAMGSRGVGLLGGSGNEARKLNGFYLLMWRAIELLRECGCEEFDLGGIDPEGNSSVYEFKARMGGREVQYVGTFECCYSPLSRLVVSVGEGLRQVVRRCRR